jgi:LmbE family N-acetylglucosaminyl deacetylase
MKNPVAGRLQEAAAGGRSVLVLSAHLDDAVLSCGALLSRLAGQLPVTVATVFTETTAPPHTRAARAFLRQCGISDAATLYAERRAEDDDVLSGLGVQHVHLGAPDALFRRRDPWPYAAWLGRVVPELDHRYPSYRFDIARGRIARGDRVLIERLAAELRTLAGRIDAAVILGPMAIGRHVDHLITRRLTERHPGEAIFYSDFPYCLQHPPEAEYIRRHRLMPVTWDGDIAAKTTLINGYRTQLGALFPDGLPLAVAETYFMAERSQLLDRSATTGHLEEPEDER